MTAQVRLKKGLVDVVADLPADAQPTEPVRQDDRLLRDSAVHSQARTMLRATVADHGGHALGPDLPAVLVTVIPPTGIDRLRPSTRAAAVSTRRRDARAISGMSWAMSLRWPPVTDTASGSGAPQ